MSIIYDALQKTQRNREYIRINHRPPPKKSQLSKLPWMILGSLCVILSAGLGGFFSFYAQMRQAAPQKGVVARTVQPAAVLQAAHLWVTQAQRPAQQAAPARAVSDPVLASIPVAAPAEAALKTNVLVASHLVLNGVLISNGDKLALINNQPFHLGDIVEGMKIVSIDPTGVRLQKDSQFVELRVSV